MSDAAQRVLGPGENALLVLKLDYSGEGAITAVEVKRSTGFAALDTAGIAWAKRLKICVRDSEPGRGMLPLVFGFG